MGWGKKIKNKFTFSFLLSVVFHFCFITFFAAKNLNIQAPKHLISLDAQSEKIVPIKLDSISFISNEKIREIKKEQTKQIVASENKGQEVAPVNSRFFGEKNNLAKRQTMTRNHGSFKVAGMGDKLAQAKSKSQESTKLQQELAAKKVARKVLNLSDLGGFTVGDVEKIESQKAEEAAQKIAKVIEHKGQGLENGNRELTGLSANNDHVEDVTLGDFTNLNTQEFKYYGFYQRIRIQLEQHWGSTIKEKAKVLYKTGRRIPASENLITSISVVLDGKGQIVEMKVEGTSGVRELDQAAIESFNKAGPFPNPPKGLLVGDRATIQWGFVVKS